MATYVLDLETTGLDPVRHRIIEVALLGVDDNLQVRSIYWALCRPNDGEVDQEALSVNGIPIDALEGALPEEQVMAQVASLICPNATIIAHHAPFDLAFLHHTFFRLGKATWDGDFFCTRASFGYLFPDRKRSLANVAEFFGIKSAGGHRALDDALMTLEVFRRLAVTAAVRGVDIRNLLIVDPERPLSWTPARARVVEIGGGGRECRATGTQ